MLIAGAYAGKYKEAREYSISKGQEVTFDPDVLGGVVSAGQVGVAIEILNEEKKRNPSAASQIDEYIKQLLAAARK
jgi:hypothetical protein